MRRLKLTLAAVYVILTATICVAQAPASERESQNGMTSRTPTKMSEKMLAPSLLGPVPTAGPWIEFGFTGVGVPATGCSPADPNGPGCAPSSAGNSVFGGAPPWTFTAPSGGAVIKVTDAFLHGDRFELFDNNVSLGMTSVPGTSGACGDDPDVCWADAQASHASFSVGAGAHSLTIKTAASPFGAGAAYFRVDLTPAMDHFVCYEIKQTTRFKQRKIAIQNQFEKKQYIVISPKLVCVPSFKKLLQ